MSTAAHRFRLSPDPRWLGMPILQEWGWVASRKAGTLGMHSNRGYEITYTEAGEFVWEVEGGGPLILRGGQICLTQPGVRHRGEHDSISPGKLFYIVFHPGLRGARRHTPFNPEELRFIDTSLRQAGNAVIRAHPSLPPLFAELHTALGQIAEGSPDPLLRPWTRSLLSQIILATSRSFLSPEREEHSDSIRQACRWLEDHLAEPVSMAAAAHAAGLNRSRFYQAFAAETGQTPTDYLISLRCTRAARALRETDTAITLIAFHHGFATSQYFATCFRRRTGLSPSAYRRIYKGAVG